MSSARQLRLSGGSMMLRKWCGSAEKIMLKQITHAP
jgi:hypothetical protein